MDKGAGMEKRSEMMLELVQVHVKEYPLSTILSILHNNTQNCEAL